MKADDPRHGTERGHKAHRRADQQPCEPCTRARMRAQKKRRMMNGVKVPALGSRRRVQALQALGWSRQRIAKEIGYTDNGAISYLMRAETMTAATAVRIAEVYDRLSMTPPIGPGVGRAKTWARRFGYPPPLAWDDIDDPAEVPILGRDSSNYRADELAAEWDHLRVAGVSIHAAATQLGVSVGAIEKAIERARKVSAA